MTMLFDVDT